jgi:sec-independent protein translocase protein TatB
VFDIGFWVLAIIAVVALMVLGPERLPRAARTAGLWISKARRTVTTMKAEIERELDVEEMKKIVGQDTVETLQEFKQEVKAATTLDKDDLPTEEDLKLPDQDNNK